MERPPREGPPTTELIQDHRTLTRRYAGRLGRADAEDLASEALARVLHSPPPDGRRAPWLERVLRNLVADRWRRASTRAERLRLAVAPPPAATPEERLLEAER